MGGVGGHARRRPRDPRRGDRDEGEVNEVRALQLLADRGGTTITSRPTAALYGFSSHSRVRPALVRLQARGLVDERDGVWYIVDPLFDEWLRRSSPLAD
jgi:hypothetical protein